MLGRIGQASGEIRGFPGSLPEAHKSWRRVGEVVPLHDRPGKCGQAGGPLKEASSPRHAPASEGCGGNEKTWAGKGGSGRKGRQQKGSSHVRCAQPALFTTCISGGDGPSKWKCPQADRCGTEWQGRPLEWRERAGCHQHRGDTESYEIWWGHLWLEREEQGPQNRYLRNTNGKRENWGPAFPNRNTECVIIYLLDFHPAYHSKVQETK